ncbi:TPA: KilA-N domain-containing protein [Vibrio vulnificus]|uniref:BRO family protein n=1 Tax=Vibrio vulnificus TaxID=672 RepID=UPI0006993BE3|nr:BRO family protein [Vibrio vulnificus]HDY7620017.1 KilA-N domain-containing protein [Vibrio vulnificus]
MPNTHLTFNQFVFNPYPVNGSEDIYLKSDELAQALGYKETDSITRIYNRNIDEFEKGMSETVKLTVSGNYQKTIRVFSLRGANLVAMKAKTPIANEFRKWVLDVLEGSNSASHSAKAHCLTNTRDLHLSDGAIRVVDGLYRLTDLSNIKKHRENLPGNHIYIPAAWKRSAKVNAFIKSIAKEYGASDVESVFKVIRSYNTEESGTYAVKEILVEYARWLGRNYLLEVEQALQPIPSSPVFLPAEIPDPILPKTLKKKPANPTINRNEKSYKCENLEELEDLAVKEISQLRAICMLIKRYADLGEKLDPEILEPTMWAALDRIDALDDIFGQTFDSLSD